ncbi:MAG: hypothetical protein AAF330_04325 [Pseudomonadota bacterium]
MATARELERLFERIARGDGSAFARLFRLTAPRLYGIALQLLGRPEAAFGCLDAAYQSIRDPGPRHDALGLDPMTWLMSRTHRACIRVLRRERRHGLRPLPSPRGSEPSLKYVYATGASYAELGQLLERSSEGARAWIAAKLTLGDAAISLPEAAIEVAPLSLELAEHTLCLLEDLPTRALEARLRRDPALRAEYALWMARCSAPFDPPSHAPPPEFEDRVRRNLFGSAHASERWTRWAGMAVLAAVAAFVVVVYLPAEETPPPPPIMGADLTSTGAVAGQGRVLLFPGGAQSQHGWIELRSELAQQADDPALAAWLWADGAPPFLIGVLGGGGRVSLPLTAPVDAEALIGGRVTVGPKPHEGTLPEALPLLEGRLQRL